MLCKAIAKGYYKKVRERGDTFIWSEDRKIPSWAVPVNPVKTEVDIKDKKKVVPTIEASVKLPAETPAEDSADSEEKELREKAKALGYKNWHNAKVETIQKFLAGK